MSLSSLLKRVLIKVESSYGVDPTPAPATDALLCRSVTASEPISIKGVDRNLVRPFFGAFQQLQGTAFVKLELEVEIAGFGTAGPATPTPGYDAALRACALLHTISAGTSVVYTPVSSGLESVTVYYWQDGTLHKITGARGDMELNLKVGEIPTYKITLTGIYNAVTDTSMTAPDVSAYITPLLVNATDTSAFSLHGYSGVLNSLSMKLGNQVETRELVGEAPQVLITDRQSTGSIEIEATTVAAHDWFTAVKNATLNSLSVTHGLTAGNIVTLAAPQVQLLNPKFSDVQNIIHTTFDARFLPGSAGGNEISITVA
jgi:hypothetical protein